MKVVKLTTGIERTWHWIHAAGIVLLILSGMNIHFAQQFTVFGTMADAVAVHNFIGWVVIADFGIWLAYGLSTMRIKFYLPNSEDLPQGAIRQAKFYLSGIFKGEEHPFEPDGVKRKFNPMQKFTYLGIMGLLVPLQVITGIILYEYVSNWTELNETMVRGVSLLHSALSYLFTAFVLGHIYLATTGETPLDHFKMMITGKSHHRG